MKGDQDSSKYKRPISLTVNGNKVEAEIDCRQTSAEFLREELDLTGTKVGCNRGECGSCTVILDGKPVYSSSILAVEARDKKVLTIEGLSKDGVLHEASAYALRKDPALPVSSGFIGEGRKRSFS